MRTSLLTLFAVCLLGAACFVTADDDPTLLECVFVRQIDGRCNNLLNIELGSVNKYLKRGAEGAFYLDGVREPHITPNARTVSNDLFRADDTIMDPHGHNAAWVFFGQFVAHDLMGVHRHGDLNATELANNPTANSNFRIFVNLTQPDDVFLTSTPPITQPWLRVIKSRGDIVNGRFEVASDSTAWLDLDTVYGKEEVVADLLRTHHDGLLVSREYNNVTVYNNGEGSIVPADQATAPDFGEWLPLMADVDINRTHIPMSNQLVPTFTRNIPYRFLASGDGRNGENTGLAMFHGLFLREHNRLARQIRADHPFWTDEMIYQRARKLNIAQYQAIVLYEYVPSLLLADTSRVGPYTGYKPLVDPTLSQLFAFAFRFGHTTVPTSYYLRNECNQRPFNSARDGPRSGQMASNEMPVDQLSQMGRPENAIHAILFEPSRRVDVQFPEGLRSIPGPAFTDVIVQNQIRAAENGIPPYNYVRKIWYGGPHADLYNRPGCNTASDSSPAPDPIECFNYINSNTTVATTLRNLYGKVNNINFYTAVVAEEPEGSMVGRTSSRIIADQFKRVRDADRWWFESPFSGFTPKEKKNFKKVKLSDVFKRNFPTLNIQEDAFYVPDSDHFDSC